jgi:hypothetical protein
VFGHAEALGNRAPAGGVDADGSIVLCAITRLDDTIGCIDDPVQKSTSVVSICEVDVAICDGGDVLAQIDTRHGSKRG